MNTINKKKKKGEEEDKIPKEVLQQYTNRLGLLRQAKDYTNKEDYVNATRYYNSYLNILAKYKRVEEKKLSPELFDNKKELSELLLISHTYWDLAKIYDRTPKLEKEFQFALDQFVNFTIGFKYQVPNSGMIKRFIKKKRLIHKEAFEKASQKIQIATKKCFISTLCFGEDSTETIFFRSWRDQIMSNFFGNLFVQIYYAVTPKAVGLIEKSKVTRKLSLLLLKPSLNAIYKFLQRRES